MHEFATGPCASVIIYGFNIIVINADGRHDAQCGNWCLQASRAQERAGPTENH